MNIVKIALSNFIGLYFYVDRTFFKKLYFNIKAF